MYVGRHVNFLFFIRFSSSTCGVRNFLGVRGPRKRRVESESFFILALALFTLVMLIATLSIEETLKLCGIPRL